MSGFCEVDGVSVDRNVYEEDENMNADRTVHVEMGPEAFSCSVQVSGESHALLTLFAAMRSTNDLDYSEFHESPEALAAEQAIPRGRFVMAAHVVWAAVWPGSSCYTIADLMPWLRRAAGDAGVDLHISEAVGAAERKGV